MEWLDPGLGPSGARGRVGLHHAAKGGVGADLEGLCAHRAGEPARDVEGGPQRDHRRRRSGSIRKTRSSSRAIGHREDAARVAGHGDRGRRTAPWGKLTGCAERPRRRLSQARSAVGEAGRGRGAVVGSGAPFGSEKLGASALRLTRPPGPMLGLFHRRAALSQSLPRRCAPGRGAAHAPAVALRLHPVLQPVDIVAPGLDVRLLDQLLEERDVGVDPGHHHLARAAVEAAQMHSSRSRPWTISLPIRES